MTEEPFDWGLLILRSVHPVKVVAIEAMQWIDEPFSAVDLKRMIEDNPPGIGTIAYQVKALAVDLPVLHVYEEEVVRGATRKLYFFRNRAPVSRRRCIWQRSAMMNADQQSRTVGATFSQNLRCIRMKRELSQEDLAQLIEMHRTEISALERGRREPRLQTLIRLSAALEVPPGDFLAGIEWHPLVPLPRPRGIGRFRVKPSEESEQRPSP